MSDEHAISRVIPHADLERLFRVGLALASERDGGRLMERILLEAKAVANADGGSLYLRTDDDQLRFEILRNDTLGVAYGGTTGNRPTLPDVPLFDPVTGAENHGHVVAHAVHLGCPVHVPDAYQAEGFDFGGTRAFDGRSGYRSRSILTLPMKNQEGRVIGVLQLINARDAGGQVVPFHPIHIAVAEALAAQAAVTLDAQQMYEGQKRLLEAFLQLLASAIDHKSPYTGGHCRRVPVLTEMIVKAMHDASDGPYAGFRLSEEEWYELHIASWLHDCGKVTTPTHVMDKATKLEGILDGLEIVRGRFTIAAREVEIAHLRAGTDPTSDLDLLHRDLALVERANQGGEVMAREDQDRVRHIAARTYRDARGEERPLLEPEEVEKLCVARGTLTEEERLVINGHMVQTVLMLHALPFPRNLKNVPEIACGHHERMDGNGYPRGLFAQDMSLPARAMAVADVFEALCASDRPYKKALRLSESMAIMGRMKENNHLDPVLFDFFVSSGIYRRYAEMSLPPELCDEVDEAALLAIVPRPFELPPPEERERRWRSFLPAYRKLARGADIRAHGSNAGSLSEAFSSRSAPLSTG